MQVPAIPGRIESSPALRANFVALTIALVALFLAGVYLASRRTGLDARTAARRAILALVLSAAWLAYTGLLAARGVLRFWAPPTMGLVLVPTVVLAIGLALSPLGARFVAGIPIAWLVGVQGFRVAVELLLHRAYVEGLMPVQMSYAGRNFDVVTGITALLLGAWLATGQRSRVLVVLWNTMGLALLLNVLVIAMLSAPTPFRVFTNEPANVWITRAPWVWLPAVMVLAALMGHVLIYRWALRPIEPRPTTSQPWVVRTRSP
jgi:hypothetical protein